ncbi:MAG: hypothetical protein CMJ50_04230 [Planctomycetaceae bacterium]|nr:hypothetical protein [Planctomycetaceae bacterium]
MVMAVSSIKGVRISSILNTSLQLSNAGTSLVRPKPTIYGRTTLKGFAERGLVGRPAHNMWREKSTLANHDLPIDRSRTCWSGFLMTYRPNGLAGTLSIIPACRLFARKSRYNFLF